MAPPKRRTKRTSKRAARKPQSRTRPGRGHNKPPAESDAPSARTPPPMPVQPSEDQTAADVARYTADHRRRLVAPVTGGTVGQGGPPFAAANDPQTVHRAISSASRRLEETIAQLPARGPLDETDIEEASRRDWIVPIVGTSKPQRLEENAAAASIRISTATLQALEKAFPVGAAMGARTVLELMPRLGL
jgi:predicted component of type VI protein secretion system